MVPTPPSCTLLMSLEVGPAQQPPVPAALTVRAQDLSQLCTLTLPRWLLPVYRSRAVHLAWQGLPVHAAHVSLAALGGARRESLDPRPRLPVQTWSVIDIVATALAAQTDSYRQLGGLPGLWNVSLDAAAKSRRVAAAACDVQHT